MLPQIATNFLLGALARVARVALAWLWLYHDVLRHLLDDWRVDENYSHGFLLPLSGAYALWQQREILRATPLAPHTGAGLLTLLCALALLWAGVLGGELYATRLSLLSR